MAVDCCQTDGSPIGRIGSHGRRKGENEVVAWPNNF